MFPEAFGFNNDITWSEIMILIVNISFPRSSVKQAAQAFTNLPKVPASVKRQGPYFSFAEIDKISSITFYSFGGGRITGEEKKFVESRMKVFCDVPGFSYSIEDWLNMEEALVVVSGNE